MSELLHLNQENFKQQIDSATVPILVDFYADWCGPCKAIAPTLEEIATEYAGQITIAKVDLDTNRDLAVEFQIRSIPTLLLFKRGTLVDTVNGAVSKSALTAVIDQHLS